MVSLKIRGISELPEVASNTLGFVERPNQEEEEEAHL